jgi:hypothetical protein
VIDALLLTFDTIAMLVLMFWSLRQESQHGGPVQTLAPPKKNQ